MLMINFFKMKHLIKIRTKIVFIAKYVVAHSWNTVQYKRVNVESIFVLYIVNV